MQDSKYSFVANEHGTFSLAVDHRVVIVRCFDAWNLETAKHYWAEMEKVARAMDGDPWAILSDLTQWELSPPEVGVKVAEMAVKLDALGRTHNAIVANDHGLRQAIVKQAIRSKTSQPVLKFFEQENEALGWLDECGFPTSAER
jgi:hypothetical protein